jgi:hypothetical protein
MLATVVGDLADDAEKLWPSSMALREDHGETLYGACENFSKQSNVPTTMILIDWYIMYDMVGRRGKQVLRGFLSL